jgi:hypothetical protein
MIDEFLQTARPWPAIIIQPDIHPGTSRPGKFHGGSYALHPPPPAFNKMHSRKRRSHGFPGTIGRAAIGDDYLAPVQHPQRLKMGKTAQSNFPTVEDWYGYPYFFHWHFVRHRPGRGEV